MACQLPIHFPWSPWKTSTRRHRLGYTTFFNCLIYHSTDNDKQGLAAYKSFEDYRLFDDGYMESLLTAQLNQEGVHVYVGKCGLS